MLINETAMIKLLNKAHIAQCELYVIVKALPQGECGFSGMEWLTGMVA